MTAAIALLGAVAVFAAPSAGFRPAGTVTFANLQTVAQTVAGIAQGADPVLTALVPAAIRNQAAAKLFGPMRPGMPGVAVCYVDEQILARLAASPKRDDEAFDRAKRWSVLYPASIGKAEFMKRHPDAKPQQNGSLKIPPGNHSRRTLYAWFAPDGNWATLAPAPIMAEHTYRVAVPALKRPLGSDLASIQMDAAGARAVFGTDACAGGTVAVRMTQAGLELHGTVRSTAAGRHPLAPGALSFAGVPATALLFGVSSSPDDVRSAEVLAFAGPEVATFVKQSLVLLNRPGANAYYLDDSGRKKSVVTAPADRLVRILPEVKSRPAANVMFCSPTAVLRYSLPRIAAKMMPLESAQMQVGLRMLRRARGDGLGFMGWREGGVDRFVIRISKDELRGTANLWSSLFL